MARIANGGIPLGNIGPLEARLVNESGEVVDSAPMSFGGDSYALTRELRAHGPGSYSVDIYDAEGGFVQRMDYWRVTDAPSRFDVQNMRLSLGSA